jgi:hypothetical protein
VEGEKLTKYWTSLVKSEKPREVIYRLQKLQTEEDHPPRYESKARQIAELAQDYYENLQYEQTEGYGQNDHENAINEVLKNIPDTQKLTGAKSEALRSFLT